MSDVFSIALLLANSLLARDVQHEDRLVAAPDPVVTAASATDALAQAGRYAGLAGIVVMVFGALIYQMLRSKLSQRERARILVAIWSLAVLCVAAWLLIEWRHGTANAASEAVSPSVSPSNSSAPPATAAKTPDVPEKETPSPVKGTASAAGPGAVAVGIASGSPIRVINNFAPAPAVPARSDAGHEP